MPKITILKENPATRCEICHQTDCFNPATNYCSRCNSVVNIAGSNFGFNAQALTVGENPHPVQPEAVEIEQWGYNYTVIYRWRSLNNLKRWLPFVCSPLLSSVNLI